MAVGQRTVVVRTEAAVSAGSAGAAAISRLSAIAPANKLLKLTELGIGFDGVTASALPILVELCRSTQAGTGTSTAATPQLVSGSGTIVATGAYLYTVEPTVLTVVRAWEVDPNKGLFVIQFPLGREPETPLGGAFVLRTSVSALGTTANLRAYMEFEDA